MSGYEQKWNSLKHRLAELQKKYKDNEQINYVVYGSKAIEVVQDIMKKLDIKL